MSSSDDPIIFYDGDCGFCGRAVIFVAERDPDAFFRFAPLQSPLGGRIRREAGMPAEDLDSIVLLDRDGIHVKSAAALRIAGGLSRPWPLAKAFLLLPRPVRDFVYDVIARNRHRILPPPDRCVLPGQLEGRMVDGEP